MQTCIRVYALQNVPDDTHLFVKYPLSMHNFLLPRHKALIEQHQGKAQAIKLFLWSLKPPNTATKARYIFEKATDTYTCHPPWWLLLRKQSRS